MHSRSVACGTCTEVHRSNNCCGTYKQYPKERGDALEAKPFFMCVQYIRAAPWLLNTQVVSNGGGKIILINKNISLKPGSMRGAQYSLTW
jgi:hypothetical protein